MVRILGLLAQLIVTIASAAAFGWWAATLVTSLLIRRLERTRPLQQGPPAACDAVLLCCVLVASLIATGLAFLVWKLLLPLPLIVGLEQHPMGDVWRGLVIFAATLTSAAGIWAAFENAINARSAARRQWDLNKSPGPQPHLPPEATRLAGSPSQAANIGRRIVILCDGTSNRPDEQEDGQASATNIWKLSQSLKSDEIQTVWYQAGVGSDTSSTASQVRRTRAILSFVGANPASQITAFGSRLVKLFESAFGNGISESILNGYTEIVRQYRPGDRIYLVGFSRGAYAARCIAGVISRCGLLKSENSRYAPQMVQRYRTRRDQHTDAQVRQELVHADPAIEFVGVFDTVGSLGVPLWGWWFRASPIWVNKALATDPVKACRYVYHALAMDERRSQFFPTLYTKPASRGADDKLEILEQVWFRGAHADIGGGYARSELSDIPLGWMMDAMRRHGLTFRSGARTALRPNALGRLHDELERKPSWNLFGSWPRWHPVPVAGPNPNGTTLHSTVLDRAAAVSASLGRPDMLRLSNPGDAVVITVEAQRSWNRTGIIIDYEGLYKVTYLGAQWRDAESAWCGPAGQQARGALDLRRWLGFGRRMRAKPWMQLVATVAHPRRWDLLERSWRELVSMLFYNDPPELTCQLAAIGKNLEKPGGAVLLRNLAPAGLLYLFANDWWQTASNNSGGIRLKIERVAHACPELSSWTLLDTGHWEK